MSILLIPRKSEDDVDIIDSSRLSYFQVTYWDIEVIIVLWVLFLVTSLFVLLRLYSRVKILQFYAAEDHLYNVAFTLLLAYNAIITYYSFHGLGSQLPNVMTSADVKLAVVFENLLFDLASIGLIVAKTSLITFLMRLVPQHHSPIRWRLMIIGPLVILGIVSFGGIMAMWARCFSELAGRAAKCTGITPAMHWMQVMAGLSVAIDLWYAAMPWYLLRRLTTPRKEKILVQASMSLGVIAAACGIARALTIYPAMNNVNANSAAILYMWHGAEMAVTMICIGMPVCRPAVSSMFLACGLVPRKPKEHNSNYPPTSSYIRNFGGGTWQEAVGGADIDSWSQRRILGVGDATSNATSTNTTNTLGLKAKETEVALDLYPMSTMNKNGITVTKTGHYER